MKRRKEESDDDSYKTKKTRPSSAVTGPDFSDEDEEQSGVVCKLFVLGQGDCGQLGKGEDFVEARLPHESLSADSQIKVVDMAAGGVHSLAIDSQSQVYSCGVNDEGALGRRTDNKIWESEDARHLNAPESNDDFEWGRVPVPLTNGLPTSVSAGDSHSSVLTDCGVVWGWGTFRDSGGVYGFQPDSRISLLPRIVYQPQSWARVIQIASGTDHMLALVETGKVLSWGTGGQGQLGRILKSEFQALREAKHRYKLLQQEVESLEEKLKEAESSRQASLQQELGISKQKYEAATGKYKPLERSMRQKQLTPSEVSIPSSKIVSISCGWYNSFAVDESGKVWSFGLDNYGQSSAARPVSQPKKLDEEEERYIYTPEKVIGLEKHNVIKVAGGNQHTLALTREGHVLSFGRTTYGRLGRINEDFENNVAQEIPGVVDGLFQVEVDGIAAGEEVSACVSRKGAVFLWGSGTNAQLGNASKTAGLRNAALPPAEQTATKGDTVDEIIPCRLDSPVFSGHKSHKVEFGGQHTLILRAE